MTTKELKDWWSLVPLLEHMDQLKDAGNELIRITGRTKAYEEMSKDDVDFWYAWLQGAIKVYGPYVWIEVEIEDTEDEDDYPPFDYSELAPDYGGPFGYHYDRLPWE